MITQIEPKNIPEELRALPQWVCWRHETRNGKTTKPPIDAKSNGQLRYAKSNNPATWSDFETAVAAATRLNLPGIGLMVSADDRLTGLDLDHVIDRVTGELDPLATEVLERFANTYTEISPSGTGFRIWCYGKAARSGKCEGARKWLEVYTHPSNRHLTTTGNRYGAATAVTEQQAALDWLHSRFMAAPKKVSTERKGKPSSFPVESAFDLDEAALLNKARKAKNGAAFDALWSGDLSAHNGDHSAADLALLNLLAFWTGKDVARMDRLFRQSSLMRDKWDVVHDPANGRTYGQMTVDKAITDGRDTFTGKKPGAKATLPRAATAPALDDQEEGSAPPLKLPTVSPCTHLANSYRIRHYYKGRIWYALGVGWILWTGKFWRSDPTNEGSIATGFVDSLSRRIATEAGAVTRRASEEVDGDRRKALMTQAESLMRWAVQSENERVIASGLKLTKHALLIEYGTLNADPWLFNVQNGTVDLRTGTLRPHNPTDLITFISPVSYDPAALCPTWERFLSEVFAGDADMVAFIQRAIGWSLTGVVKERALFFLHGNAGKNGKTTMVEAMMKLVGNCGESSYGYGRKVGADTFMKSRNSEDNQRKAATLAGPRFVCTSEVDEEHRLNEQLVKDITGGDTLEGRRLYQEAFTFKPQFKPWMYGNHKPEIRGTDDAMWSRVRLVPFEVSFRGREDLDLADKLEAELSGILNWAIQGCLDWQRTGLQPPAKVQAATQAYREEMDVFGPFIAECCVINRAADVKAQDLWNAYRAWCADNGHREQTQHKFGRYLTAKGWKDEGTKPVKRVGIGLLEKHHADHTDHTDLIPETSLIEPLYSDFPEKGRKGRKGREDQQTSPADALSSHLVDASPPVESKPVCSQCRHLAPVIGGCKCLIHKENIAAINTETCNQWAARGLIGGVK